MMGIGSHRTLWPHYLAGFVAVFLVATVVAMATGANHGQPNPPAPVGGVTTDDLERLADTLEDLSDDPDLSEPEREAVADVVDVVDSVREGHTPVVPDPLPPIVPLAPPPTTDPPTVSAPRVVPEPPVSALPESEWRDNIIDGYGITPTTGSSF